MTKGKNGEHQNDKGRKPADFRMTKGKNGEHQNDKGRKPADFRMTKGRKSTNFRMTVVKM